MIVSERNGAALAQKIQTLFIDDLDGSEAEGTVRFGLDGTEYEIDLNAERCGMRGTLCASCAAGRGPCAAASPRRTSGTGSRGGQYRGPRVGQGTGHRGKGPRATAR